MNNCHLSSSWQFQLKLNWVSLNFNSSSHPATHPATDPATHPAARNSSEISGIWFNLLFNFGRTAQGDLKSALKKLNLIIFLIKFFLIKNIFWYKFFDNIFYWSKKVFDQKKFVWKIFSWSNFFYQIICWSKIFCW